MDEIREIINDKLKEIDALLKVNDNKRKLIETKNKYLDFIYLLDIYEKFKLSRREIIDVIKLPITCTDISEYRLIEDLDTEDRNVWEEVEINNHPLRLSSHDVIIKKRK